MFNRRHSSHSFVSTHEKLLDGVDYAEPQFLVEDVELPPGERVNPHVSVHGRGYYHWLLQQGAVGNLGAGADVPGSHHAGLWLASATSRLSHWPLLIFARVFAESGAINSISAHFISSMCNTGSPGACQVHSDSSVYTVISLPSLIMNLLLKFPEVEAALCVNHSDIEFIGFVQFVNQL